MKRIPLMTDRRNYVVSLLFIFIYISKIPAKKKTVFFSSQGLHGPYVYIERMIILPVFLKIDMIKAFFASYKNVIVIDRINMFEPADHFTFQFRQINNRRV